jgi:hypothetical protein
LPPPLAHVAVAFLETLVPQSAGADLLARGIGLNFDNAAQLNVPGIAVLCCATASAYKLSAVVRRCAASNISTPDLIWSSLMTWRTPKT